MRIVLSAALLATLALPTAARAEDAPSCAQFTIAPEQIEFPAEGGEVGSAIAAPVGCHYVITTDPEQEDWLSVSPAEATIQAPGEVIHFTFTAPPNEGEQMRNERFTFHDVAMGQYTDDDAQFVAYQSGVCGAPTVSAQGLAFGTDGQAQMVHVDLPATCAWAPIAIDSWLHVAPAANMSGPRDLSISADPTTDAIDRSSGVYVVGTTIAVAQGPHASSAIAAQNAPTPQDTSGGPAAPSTTEPATTDQATPEPRSGSFPTDEEPALAPPLVVASLVVGAWIAARRR